MKNTEEYFNISHNAVTISGEIVSGFIFSHEICGGGFYTFYLRSKRLSEATDIVPIMVSERLVDIGADWRGRFVKIGGQFRSYNKHEGGKTHLILSVFARKIEETEEIPFGGENRICFDGHICSPPVYRKTPLGREICDIILAVNRCYGKSDYIPCVAWGRNARFTASCEVGTHIQIEGRIQSREYKKRISEGETETRVCYEVSCGKISRVTEKVANE